MINLLKRKISDGCYAADVAIITIALIAGGLIWHNFAQASISSFTITPTVLGADDVVAFEADYDVSYQTDSTGTVSTITVTFPSDYSLSPSFVHDPSIFVQSDAATGGHISINGTDQQITGADPVGQDLIITLATPFDYNSTPGASDTVSFRILRQVTNTTTARTVSAAEYSVDDDAAGNNPQTAGADVTIIPGPAFTLDFTTQPSHAPAPSNGDIESGTVLSVQPVVTAHDRYGNVATSYDTDVVSLVLGGSAPGTIQFGAASPDLCGGFSLANSFQVAAVAGVADFSSALASYYATADQETITLEAAHTCGSNGGNIGSNGVSSTLTVDVVANSLEWSASPSGCATTSACTTQGTVVARSILNLGRTRLIVTDSDYTGDVTISHNGTGTLVGTALQGAMTAGSITLSGIGYTLASAATPETINFVATSGSLTQGESDSVTVTVAPVASPSPRPTPVSIGGGINPRFDERPTTEPVATAPGGTGSRTSPASAPTGSSNSVAPTSSCAPYITSYMKLGSSGEEVVKLQQFLLKYGFFQDGFTGFFGEQTEEAVKRFQEQYTQDVLKYWGLTEGTGYVYITTTKKINELVCQES